MDYVLLLAYFRIVVMTYRRPYPAAMKTKSTEIYSRLARPVVIELLAGSPRLFSISTLFPPFLALGRQWLAVRSKMLTEVGLFGGAAVCRLPLLL